MVDCLKDNLCWRVPPKLVRSLVDCFPVCPQNPKGNELKQVVQVNICGRGLKTTFLHILMCKCSQGCKKGIKKSRQQVVIRCRRENQCDNYIKKPKIQNQNKQSKKSNQSQNLKMDQKSPIDDSNQSPQLLTFAASCLECCHGVTQCPNHSSQSGARKAHLRRKTVGDGG